MAYNKIIKIAFLINEIIFSFLIIFISFFLIWASKLLKIIYYIIFCISFLLFLIHIIISFCKRKLESLKIFYIFVAFLLLIYISETIILWLNNINYNLFWNNCPYLIQDLDYNLNLKRRCELYSLNNNSRYSYQYLCTFNSEKDFNENIILLEKKQQNKVVCGKPKYIYKNSNSIRLLNYYKNKTEFFFCNRTNIPKDDSFIAKEKCTDDKDNKIIIFFILSVIICLIFFIYIIIVIKFIKKKKKNISDKLKVLIYISIYENFIDYEMLSSNNIKLFFMNKKYLEEHFNYRKINDLVKQRINKIDNNCLEQLDLNFFHKIKDKFNKDEIKHLYHDISDLTIDEDLLYKAEGKEIKISNSKIKIYTNIDIVCFNEKIYHLFQNIFQINNFIQQNIYCNFDKNNQKYIFSSEIIKKKDKEFKNKIYALPIQDNKEKIKKEQKLSPKYDNNNISSKECFNTIDTNKKEINETTILNITKNKNYISIKFIDSDQKNYPIQCNKKDKFENIINKLYEYKDFKDLKEKLYFFKIVKGKEFNIDQRKTLEENVIKVGMEIKISKQK